MSRHTGVCPITIALLDSLYGLVYVMGMAKEKRLQLNLRVEQEDLDAIERIRRALSPLPSVTDAVRQAIHELDKRLAKKGGR